MASIVNTDSFVSSSPAPTHWSLAVLPTASDFLSNLGVELIFAICTLIFAFLGSALRRRTFPRKLAPKCRRDKAVLSSCVTPPTLKATVPQVKNDPVVRIVEQVISMKLPAAKTLQEYEQMRKQRGHINLEHALASAKLSHTVVDFYAALIQCAGRAGNAHLIEEMFSDMAEIGLVPPASLFESAMKLLAGKSRFKEAIDVYLRMERCGFAPSPTSMSCAIGFAVEFGDLDLAISIFNQLSSQAVPSLRACMAALRVHAKRSDWNAAAALFSSVHARGVEVDCVLLNIVLSTGVACGQVDAAEALLFQDPGASIADVVSFNIILKGLAQSCAMDRTTGLLHKMMERGIQPNLISFNTVLDATVRSRRSTETWRVYDLMEELHMQPDKCTCSTLVKTFVVNRHETEKRVAMVLDLIEKVEHSCSDSLLQSLLNGCLAASLRLKPSLVSLTLAKRAFAGITGKNKMLSSAADVRSLLATVAALACPTMPQIGDDKLAAAALIFLRLVWRHAPEFGADLADAKQGVERRTEDGDDLAVATLAELGKRQLRAIGTAAGKAHESSSAIRCSEMSNRAARRRPGRV